MEEIFALIVSMILIAAVIPLFLWKRRVDARSREEDAQPPQVTSQFFFCHCCEMDCYVIPLFWGCLKVQARENVVRGTGGGGRMRRRPAASAGASSFSASNVQGSYFTASVSL